MSGNRGVYRIRTFVGGVLVLLLGGTALVRAQYQRDLPSVSSGLMAGEAPSADSSPWNYRDGFSSLSGLTAETAVVDTAALRIRWRPFDLGTMGTQTVAGLGAAAIIGGLTVAAASGFMQGSRESGIYGAFVILVAGSVATAAATPIGVYYGGEWSGGNGDFGWTMLGGLGGSVAAALPVLTGGGLNLPSAVPVFVISGLVGSMLGYHLSATPIYFQDPMGKGTTVGGVSVTIELARF